MHRNLLLFLMQKIYCTYINKSQIYTNYIYLILRAYIAPKAVHVDVVKVDLTDKKTVFVEFILILIIGTLIENTPPGKVVDVVEGL